MLATTRWIVLLALIATGFLLGTVRVSAHADYDRSEPARNAVLQEAPTQVDVWFTQEVFKKEGANFVRVFDEQEVQVSDGDGVVDDDDRTHISTTLSPDLPDGLYMVRWFTTSDEDGDTDNGSFCFSVGVEFPAAAPEDCAVEEDGTPTTAAATSTEAAPAATPTEAAVVATPTADAVSDGAEDSDDDGVPTVAIVVGVVAAVAVLVVVIGAVAVWLRRTLA